MFQLLLTRYGVPDVLIVLKPDEPVAVIGGGESFDCAIAMFEDTTAQTIGDATVKGTRKAGHEVDMVTVVASGH
jgi:hypothetical protein